MIKVVREIQWDCLNNLNALDNIIVAHLSVAKDSRRSQEDRRASKQLFTLMLAERARIANIFSILILKLEVEAKKGDFKWSQEKRAIVDFFAQSL